jgi:uncharacterized membrane protein (DUF106 family)
MKSGADGVKGAVEMELKQLLFQLKLKEEQDKTAAAKKKAAKYRERYENSIEKKLEEHDKQLKDQQAKINELENRLGTMKMILIGVVVVVVVVVVAIGVIYYFVPATTTSAASAFFQSCVTSCRAFCVDLMSSTAAKAISAAV